MSWQRELLKIMQKNKNKKVALAIDTSNSQTDQSLIEKLRTFIKEMNPDTTLIQADFKIRDISNVTEEKALTYYKHGKSSYTDVLEWANEEEIDTLLYVTDLTGYIYDELTLKPFIYWLVPDQFKPKAPFGKVLNIT
ncbi:VWA-like domain-containing protein [Halalkalibacter alkalisediminis]|uniref:VWA-like domain-containing protein n=1 Tax=Halalkalibacter alkalisediminis TaxID=935616 RepID=A0ABV6NJ03_9BACI|nr:VWA-like domain-containing protein [Halalkalibacter alkalisediminis]